MNACATLFDVLILSLSHLENIIFIVPGVRHTSLRIVLGVPVFQIMLIPSLTVTAPYSGYITKIDGCERYHVLEILLRHVINGVDTVFKYHV